MFYHISQLSGLCNTCRHALLTDYAVYALYGSLVCYVYSQE